MSANLARLLKDQRDTIIRLGQQLKAAQQALDNFPAESPAKTVYDHEQWLKKKQALEGAVLQAGVQLRHARETLKDLEKQDYDSRQMSIF